MPRLMRTMARTAVVAGTATAVSGRVARRQSEKYADRDQAIAANTGAGFAEGAQSTYAPAPAPAPAAGGDDMIEQLKALAQLKDQGILTEEEFAAQKAKLLA
jgi:predicted Zn-dependent peptidase